MVSRREQEKGRENRKRKGITQKRKNEKKITRGKKRHEKKIAEHQKTEEVMIKEQKRGRGRVGESMEEVC